ncbi:antibiotic biosynthesis monooxygenase family protein [Planobispora siamensis]|uniref:Polysaccharide biosynthesis protein n=1 Tax=Planobispora siamensis TaxID=936338 RepID=A0A8J3WM12_9ACTN|nr:antibiotic biosynthesis monooxygenase [Planobispora siamensis]GIH93047.1 polysaccharide biosynthesis protein [Planobispora siamensis]
MSTSFTRPAPPYYAVIIRSRLSGEDHENYEAMNTRMAELGRGWPGYLGRESLTGADGGELTVLYYADEESIASWKADPEHLEAQRLGRDRWYDFYDIEIARVERAYGFRRENGRPGHGDGEAGHENGRS